MNYLKIFAQGMMYGGALAGAAIMVSLLSLYLMYAS